MNAKRLFAVLALLLAVVPALAEDADGRLMKLNGTELFVLRMGAGETVLVIHGGPMLDHGYLLPHLAPLAEDYELVFYDQRVNGRSSADVAAENINAATFVEDIEALRTAVGADKVDLLAHSWGGFLAMHYAIAHPENVRSIVLLNSMHPTAAGWQAEQQAVGAKVTEEDKAEMQAARQGEGIAAGDPEAIADLLRLSFRTQFHDRSKAAELNLYVPEDYMARSGIFRNMMADLADYDLAAGLAKVEAPVLVLYGASEPAAELSGPALEKAFPNARLVVLPDAGHFPFIEQPEAFLDAVRAFLSDPKRR